MEGITWILIDTETTGTKSPIYPVEIAAQKMGGWNKQGPPFQRLINQNRDVPAEASRVHGYTREILERDGLDPRRVYQEFSEYVGGGYPIVAFNLNFDWARVLIKEWSRLGISPIGKRGFCAMRLAQRLLDPCPAGNCKLQTLRQYYDLDGGRAHAALGDVETTLSLMQKVLRPIAERKGFYYWDELERYAEKKFYPSKLSFGKYRGRDYREAKTDPEFRSWLEWLAGTGEGNHKMAEWYLKKLGFQISRSNRAERPKSNASRETIHLTRNPGDGISSTKESRSNVDRETVRSNRDTNGGASTSKGLLSEPKDSSSPKLGPVAIVIAIAIFGWGYMNWPNFEERKVKAADAKWREEAKKSREPTPGFYQPVEQSETVATQKPEPDLEGRDRLQPLKEISLPTDLRFWTFRDGRKEIMRAITLDWESEAVSFRHPSGKEESNVSIQDLEKADQDFLMGHYPIQ